MKLVDKHSSNRSIHLSGDISYWLSIFSISLYEDVLKSLITCLRNLIFDYLVRFWEMNWTTHFSALLHYTLTHEVEAYIINQYTLTHISQDEWKSDKDVSRLSGHKLAKQSIVNFSGSKATLHLIFTYHCDVLLCAAHMLVS